MQQGNFIHVFLARHVKGTYTHHQEHYMLSRSIWFSAPSFWIGGGLESSSVGRVYSQTTLKKIDHTAGFSGEGGENIDHKMYVLIFCTAFDSNM